jgi:hypothetical protein
VHDFELIFEPQSQPQSAQNQAIFFVGCLEFFMK